MSTATRAPRVWHIEPRFGRFYVINQFGGFEGWHDTYADAEQQLAQHLAENPDDSRDEVQPTDSLPADALTPNGTVPQITTNRSGVTEQTGTLPAHRDTFGTVWVRLALWHPCTIPGSDCGFVATEVAA